jgi:hypothetical protein
LHQENQVVTILKNQSQKHAMNMEKQTGELSTQEPLQQQSSFLLWLLKKLIQYTDGTFQALFTAAIFSGALLIAQHVGKFLLLPFNVLDTILLAITIAIIVLGLISLILWLGLRFLFRKQPEIFILLGLVAFLHLFNNTKFSHAAGQKEPPATDSE